MFVQPFFVRLIAHSSYLVGDGSALAVVDPERHVDVYLDAAADLGAPITHVLETHLHADFVSGHRELAARTGARIVAPLSAGCAFPHHAVAEGDVIRVGSVELAVLETPGHTPEHVSYVARDTARGADPAAVFCGDTLFVNDVGRPDLFPGRAESLAADLFASLHRKLLALPDYCEVYPAHGAGSLCGRSLGRKRSSTVGYERRNNPALQHVERDGFVRHVTADMPAAPDHFARLSAVNAAGPALLADLPEPEALPAGPFGERAGKEGALVLDVRDFDAFGSLHVPGAWHVDLASNFPTFAGWVLPGDCDVLLVADGPAQAREARLWLARVGLDRVTGRLESSMASWASAGLPAGRVPQLTADALHDLLAGDHALTLVDVRSPEEFAAGHIDGALNVPAPDLRTRHRELDPEQPVVLLCQSGRRSSLGTSILLQQGFRDVRNVAGGMTGARAAGKPPVCAVCMGPVGPDAWRAVDEPVA